MVEHDDLGNMAHAADALADDERGSSLLGGTQRILNRAFGPGVHAGGGLVQDEDARVQHQGSGNGYPLLLAAGERDAALADHSFVAVGQRLDELMNLGQLGGRHNLRAGGVGPAVGDVSADAIGKHKGLLMDDADLSA